MAGQGNLILKRGTTIPQDGQSSTTPTLLKAMPATQLVGLSHVVDATGSEVGSPLIYAYDNYPNRLWIGMDEFGSGNADGQESGSGMGEGATPGTMSGAGAPDFSNQNISGAQLRPIWMGAEIRANTAVYGNSDSIPTILQADWAHPSDYVLVTQKAIHDYVNNTGFSFSVEGDAGVNQAITNNETLKIKGANGVVTTAGADNLVTVDIILTGDVTIGKGGAATVNSVSVQGADTKSYVYPMLTPGIGSNKGIYIDEDTVSPASVLKYLPVTGILEANTMQGNVLTSLDGNLTTGNASTQNNIFISSNNIKIGGTASGVGASVQIGSSAGANGSTSSTLVMGAASATNVEIKVPSGSSANTAKIFNSDVTTIDFGQTGTSTAQVNILKGANAANTNKNLNLATGGGSGLTAVNIATTTNGSSTVNMLTGIQPGISHSLTIGTLPNPNSTFPGYSGTVDLNTPLKFKTYANANGTGSSVTIQNAWNNTATYTLTLPSTAPTAGYALVTDGNGILSWGSLGNASTVSVTNDSNNTDFAMIFADKTNATPALLRDGGNSGQDLTYNPYTNTLKVKNLVVTGVNTIINTSTLSVDDQSIVLGDVVAVTDLEGNISSSTTTSATVTLSGNFTTGGLIPGQGLTKTSGSGSFGTGAIIATIVSETVFTISTTTTSTDGTIVFNVGGSSVYTGNGGGIILRAGDDRTITWSNSSLGGNLGTWNFSENIVMADGSWIGQGGPTNPVRLLDKNSLLLYNPINTGYLQIVGPDGESLANNNVVTPAQWRLPDAPTGTAGQVLGIDSVTAATQSEIAKVRLKWLTPATSNAESVVVRKETGSNLKYPIPFLGSTASTGVSDPGYSAFDESWSEAGTKTGYMYSDYAGQDGTGLMYQVDDSGGGSYVGTLFCDYIGATLDCGTY